MENQDFTTHFTVNKSPREVYHAINNIRGWWSENIEGATDQLNSTFRYHYQDVHKSAIKITVLVPGSKVVWHILENFFKFTKDENEWTGTDIIFDISEQDGKTNLTFTHKGLIPTYECFELCRDAWTHYIQGSLKELITTGKGSPTPKEENVDQEIPSSDQSDSPVSYGIYHRLRIDVPVETVYYAITTQKGLAGWWTPDTTAQAVTGTILTFAFGPDYYTEMKVEELHPYDKVKWTCLKAQEEWIGTTITFDLDPHVKGTVLNFRHDNWKGYTREFAGCNYAWALFLRSLKLLCETGKGLPYPEFDKH